MPVGVVKWFDTKKGFGFVVDEQGQDVFVHYSVIEGDGFRRLKDGEKVEYELQKGPKGLNASVVRRIEAPAPRITADSPNHPPASNDGHSRL